MTSGAQAIPAVDEASFWANVEKTDRCWWWRGPTNGPGGYGQVRVGRRRLPAHRLAYQLYYKVELPAGLFACHHCDHRQCVNPEHIYPGTAQDNARDAMQRGQIASGERHGSHTHPESRSYGERNGAAKLTVDMVRALRLLLQKGDLTQVEIASRFGVDSTTVRRIKRGSAWVQVI